MFITIGDKTRKNMSILEIYQYPFSTTELKTNFKRLISENHPDKGGNAEKASAITSAYNELKNLAISESTEEKCQRLRNEQDAEIEKDMFYLFNSCEHCKGTGKERYIVGSGKQKSYKFRRCLKCHGVGRFPVNPFNPVIEKGAIL